MVKIRKIASIEKGIEEVIKILDEDEIQDAIIFIFENVETQIYLKLHHSDAVKII